jgi:diguanylate cyclase (GGDEF)-like protein/PAS domain S-box-containing protein
MLLSKKNLDGFVLKLTKPEAILVYAFFWFLVITPKSCAENKILGINFNAPKLSSSYSLKKGFEKNFIEKTIRNKSIIESESIEVFNPEEIKKSQFNLKELPKNNQFINVDISFYQKYKNLVWITSSGFIAFLVIIVLLIEVIRRRSITEKILRENEQRYKDLAEAGANLFWELDANLTFCYVSGNSDFLQNFSAPENLVGKTAQEILKNNPKINFDWEDFQRLIETRLPIKNFLFSVQEDELSMRIFKLNGNPIFDKNGLFWGYRGIKREITEEYNLTQKIAYQAAYDSLTGLLNRREFDNRLQEAVKKAKKYGVQSFLCYLDLDQFKIVNDTAGHLVGDRLLAELAQLLQTNIRTYDILGRLGGDEFGLLLESCSPEQAKKICEQLIQIIKNYQFNWQNRRFNLGVSIGMVSILPTSSNATELLSRADLACYKAKDLGRGRVYITDIHDEELELQQTQMMQIANVTQAIEENRFYLVKQLIKPIFKVNNPYLHYEILLRLEDENGQSISTSEFIPAAERYGAINIIDRWVLKTIINNYSQFFGYEKVIVSINLSGVSISDERFVTDLTKLIEQANIDPSCLCLEITETATISQIERAQQFINSLKKLGIKFALDDFGSGVSSFGYLKNLPVDYLKIDGSLVKNIVQEKCDRSIVRLINEIAHMMGMETIAEFVENDEILEKLTEIGVDYVQGYRISKPTNLLQLLTTKNTAY